MSIAKTSALRNSYRYFVIAADRYEGGRLQGMIFHNSKPGGVKFDGLIDMAADVNTLLDEMKYPKQAVELRSFKGMESGTAKFLPQEPGEKKRKGRLATFRVDIRYRYHASWQGKLTWIEGNKTVSFDSFMNMLLIMDGILGKKGEVESSPMGSAVVVDLDRGLEFQNIMALLKYMEGVLCTAAENSWRGLGRQMTPSQTLEAYQRGGKKATFIIRVLFREHGTWQGRICWREHREEVSFRSFLEMIMLMTPVLGGEFVSGAGSAGKLLAAR